jgi:hypothetical protein
VGGLDEVEKVVLSAIRLYGSNTAHDLKEGMFEESLGLGNTGPGGVLVAEKRIQEMYKILH